MDPAACRDSRKERQMKNPQFHIAHIGINAQGEQDAAQIAEKLKAIFGFEYAAVSYTHLTLPTSDLV